MVYATADVTGDSAANVTLKTALDSLLTAHPSWTFIETSTTYGQDVDTWKNDANDAGVTFYIHVSNQFSTYGVAIAVSELYNDTTHYPARLAPAPYSTYTPDATYATYSESYSWTGAWFVYFGYTTASDYTYRMAVTRNGIYAFPGLWSQNHPTGLFVWDRFYPTAENEFPLGIGRMFTPTEDDFSGTRQNPNKGVSTSDAFKWYATGYYSLYNTIEGTANSSFWGDGSIDAFPDHIQVKDRNSNVKGQTFDDALQAQVNTSAVSYGDTVTINGDSYVVLDGPTSGSFSLLVNTEG